MNFLYNLEFLMDRNKINRSELATLKNLSKLASFFDVSMEALVYGDRHSLTFTLDNYSEAELKAIHDFSQYIKESRSHE